jgi:outer membrane protein OmpA-like peptidoglycan-associated protein
MNRRNNDVLNDEELNIFQAFTDLMSNAFMIISFFLFVNLLHLIGTNAKLQSANEKLRSAFPIIIDEKSGGFAFLSGSAELPLGFKKYLQDTIINKIEKATKNNKNIDFIQIIGHTDSQGISNTSNLDAKLTSAANGNEKITTLQAGSNTDLGLMRAVAVVRFLKAKGLDKVKFRAYSAGQLYLPSGELVKIDLGADDTRRRIEIRFIPYGQKK